MASEYWSVLERFQWTDAVFDDDEAMCICTTINILNRDVLYEILLESAVHGILEISQTPDNERPSVTKDLRRNIRPGVQNTVDNIDKFETEPQELKYARISKSGNARYFAISLENIVAAVTEKGSDDVARIIREYWFSDVAEMYYELVLELV